MVLIAEIIISCRAEENTSEKTDLYREMAWSVLSQSRVLGGEKSVQTVQTVLFFLYKEGTTRELVVKHCR